MTQCSRCIPRKICIQVIADSSYERLRFFRNFLGSLSTRHRHIAVNALSGKALLFDLRLCLVRNFLSTLNFWHVVSASGYRDGRAVQLTRQDSRALLRDIYDFHHQRQSLILISMVPTVLTCSDLILFLEDFRSLTHTPQGSTYTDTVDSAYCGRG